MATQKQIRALKIDENAFELTEDTELEYLPRKRPVFF